MSLRARLFQFTLGLGCSVAYSLYIIEEFRKQTNMQLAVLDLIEKDVRGEILMRPDAAEDFSLAGAVLDRYKNKWLTGVTGLAK